MFNINNEDKDKFRKYLIEFFNNAYSGEKISLNESILKNFNSILENFNFKVSSRTESRGRDATKPWIIFLRTDTPNYNYYYGVYVCCNIDKEKEKITISIGESEDKDKKVKYKAKEEVDKYNVQSNNEAFDYKNLNDDIDKIIDKIIENMQWFMKLPLDEIQDIDDKLFKNQNIENENKIEKIINENKNIPLNQILYGPPGTGKTYHTIDKALEILGENLENRDEKKEKFDEYVKNGQIVFTTFHQSYGYEEFVEGIKPIIDNDENSQEVKYDIKDGIFKKLCKKALENRDSIKSFNFYINDLKEKAKEDSNNPEKYFKLPNTKYSIQYRGGKTFRIKFDDMSKNHKDYPVNIDNIEKLYKTSSVDEIYNLAYVRAILNYLKSQGLRDYEEKDEKTNLPYIIIIDEINRGNVSKIFGELITLIEPSKRIGEPEELKVRLPYSGEEFGVPKNVYIIGTMNTADRSITSLDTALRRRFEFVEMMPDVSKLSTDCEGVNLQELLKAMNTRIECLLDREKTIGHAFFIGVKNLNDLKNVFQNKIIPLLQEYFYNDYALIYMVLNKKNGILEEQDINNDYLKNMTEFIENDKIYKFSDSQKWDETTFKKIYMNNENK
ncbi:McrB family protein [Campylobacter armoricus]|uniref:McrB family protein n=1 Tax=Campylobacter armoricus TaxID=2505970 RepID=UPI0039BE47AB